MNKSQEFKRLLHSTELDRYTFKRVFKILRLTSIYLFLGSLQVAYAGQTNAAKLETATSVAPQQKNLSGKVTDKSGFGMPGVSVVLKGTSIGTITDIDGRYNLSNLTENSTLIFSFMGTKSQEVVVGNRSTINIVLEDESIGLQEVVAIGYGVVKKSDITGSVGSVSSKQLLAAPITSLDAGMKGKIAGVTIQQTSGAPGQSMKMRIRGGASINYSNDPLYVIDGFIGADITSINPADIASVDVLKDASATAIYGSRGANGVVLITTNAPKKGSFKVSMEVNQGFSNMTNHYDLLTPVEIMGIVNEQWVGQGKSTVPFSAAEIANYTDGTKQGTDWVDLITQQGVTQNYSLSATGGDEKLQYYLSMNHNDETGIFKNTFYKRSSIRSNISAQITPKIKLVFNTFGVHTSSQGNAKGDEGLNNPIATAVHTPSFWAPYDASGANADPTKWESYNGLFLVGNYRNPMDKIRQNQENFSDKIISNLDLTFDLGHNLTFGMSNAGSYSTGYYGNRTLEDVVTITRNTITATQGYSRGGSWIHSDNLTYDKSFGKHDLKVSAIYEYSKNEWRNLASTVGSLSTLANEWYLLGLGVPTNVTSGYGEGAMRSYMGRLNYGYAGKYLFTASMRADGTSSFLPENRWGYFPSAALAWRASEEEFIKNLGFVNNLKVRVGYGSTGNVAVGTTDTQNKLLSTVVSNQTLYPMIDGVLTNGIRPADPTNPNLHWEATTQYNLGIDYAMFGGKLSATIDLYSKTTDGVIIATSIPRYTGFSSFTDNAATISNKGIEIGINANILTKKDFTWDANFNFTKNVNNVDDLGKDVNQIFVASEEALGMWGYPKFVVKKGQSLGSFWGLKKERLWQVGEEAAAAVYKSKPGEWKYEDIDGVAGISATDRQIIGNASPGFSYAFGTSAAYKGFDLSVQCVGNYGNEIYNYSKNLLSQTAFIQSADYRNRWTPDNTTATVSRAPIGQDYSLTHMVSQYIEDGSFFKISNLTIGYALSPKALKAIKLSSVRFYGSVNNLLTITKYSGLDPEGSSAPNNSDSQAGIDSFSYPLTRTFTAGLKVTF